MTLNEFQAIELIRLIYCVTNDDLVKALILKLGEEPEHQIINNLSNSCWEMMFRTFMIQIAFAKQSSKNVILLLINANKKDAKIGKRNVIENLQNGMQQKENYLFHKFLMRILN